MRKSGLRSTRYRSLSWLWVLALLLPLAQHAASWHGLTHLAQRVTAQGVDEQAPHSSHCELCLAAADLGGGGLLGVPPSVPVPLAHDDLPQAAAGSVFVAPATLAYLSRAPPSTPV